jgi:hypothetical protein
MSDTKIYVSAIIFAVALLSMILVHTQGVSAALPLFGGVKKLQVYVKLYSADSKSKNLLVSIQYKGVLKTQDVTMKGPKTVIITFPALAYGIVDYYTACVKNKSTLELNCLPMIWWDHNKPSYVSLNVYNTS